VTDRERVSQALQKIAQLEQQLEYEQALVLADRTIAEGISTRDQLADLHLIAGRLAAGLDHPDVAQQHFAKVLALRPDTVLVVGTSPKVQAPFDAAKAAPHDLVVRIGGLPVSPVSVVRDSLHLVAGYRLLDDRRIMVFDEYGNELATLSEPALPPEPTTRAWIPWAAVSGVALVGGGLCAWRFGIAQDEWNRENDGMHDYSRLHALEDRGQHWAIAADIGFGLAAAGAVTAAIIYGMRDPRPAPTMFALTGTGATYTAHF
jgi:hypothetical protein